MQAVGMPMTHMCTCKPILLVPQHKAVAEVSKIGHYRRSELSRCMHGTAKPLVHSKVIGVVLLFGAIAAATSNTTAA